MNDKAREILENLLRVIVGASQIAIDREADSGVIDFKETIDRTLKSLYEVIEKRMPKERHTEPEQCLDNEMYRNSCRSDYIFNQARSEVHKVLKEVFEQ